MVLLPKLKEIRFVVLRTFLSCLIQSLLRHNTGVVLRHVGGHFYPFLLNM